MKHAEKPWKRHPLRKLGRNKLRNRIIHFLDLSPFLTVQELARRSKCSETTVRHHLRMLARDHYVVEVKPGGRQVYYQRNWNVRKEPLEATWRIPAASVGALHGHWLRKLVWLTLLEEGPMMPGNLRAALPLEGEPLPPSKLAYHLGVMVKSGALTSKGSGKGRSYAVAAGHIP